MSKTIKRGLVLLVLVALVATSCVLFVGCAKSDESFDTTVVNVDLKDAYVKSGEASCDLTKFFGTGTFALKAGVEGNSDASVAGNTLTFGAATSVVITVNNVEKTVHSVVADIVTDDASLRAAVENGKNAILANDFSLVDQSGANAPAGENRSVVLKGSVYGNGHTIYLQELIKNHYKKNGKVDDDYYAPGAFSIDKADVVDKLIEFNGVKLIGRNFEAVEGSTLPKVEGLSDFEGQGGFFNFNGDDTIRPNFSAKSCVFVNGHKMFFFRNSDVSVDTCVFQNASDNVLCMQTNGDKGATLKTKDIAIKNSLDAAILFCGWNATNSDDDFCELTIEGYLDIYNWKNTKTAKLMPNTEDFASLVNGMVQSQMGKKKFQKYMYAYGDMNDKKTEKFIHSGIIAIATGDLDANYPKINGITLDEGNIKKSDNGIWKDNNVQVLLDMKYQMRTFPIPSIAKGIAKTCFIVGYGNTKDAEGAYITPKTVFADRVDDTTGIYVHTVA